jgi:hypothetical protein
MQSISPSLGQRRKFQCYSIRNNFQLNTNNNGNHGLEWSLTNERAYNGGTCVQLLGTICDPLTENPLFTSRLFKVSIAGQSYISGWFIGNSLLGSSEAGVYIRISCDSKIIQKLISESKKENSIYSYNDEAIILLPKMAVSKELNKRYFEISVGEKFQITEIGIYVMANNSRSAEYHTNLGEIFLSTDNSDSLSSATNVAVNNLKLSPDGMLLSWDCAENGSLIDHFNVYSGDRWLGSAFAKCFKLLIAVIDQPIFRVVPVDRQGREHETKQ